MTREVPAIIADAARQLADRAGMNTAERDLLNVIIRCAYEGGLAQGRVDGAESMAIIARANVATGGAA